LPGRDSRTDGRWGIKIAFAQQNSAVGNPITSEEKLLNSPPAGGHGIGVRVMQNTAALLVGRGIALVIAGVAGIWLVRCLSPERLGEYAAIYAFVSLFVWVASWGVGPLIAREAALNRGQAGSIIFTGMCLAAAFAGAAALLALALAPVAHLGGKMYPLLNLAAVEILLMVPFSFPGVIFQVDLRQWYPSLFNVIRQVLWLGVVMAAYFLGAPLLYIILGRVGAAAVEMALNWHFARRLVSGPRVFLSPLAKRLIHGGLVVTLTTVAFTIYLRIDQVMLHRMASDAALGQYAAAVRISELFEALPAAFGSSLFPLLVISIADLPRFRRHLDLGYRYMILASVALSIAFCTGARPILGLLYGAKYAAAAPLLAILIWSEVAVFFGSTLANAMLAAGLQRIVLWPTIAGAVVNIGLNLYMIPHYGAWGAAWATVIAYWTCWTVAFLPFRECREIVWVGLRLLIPFTAVALAVTGLSFLAPVGDWVRPIIAVVAFAGLACIFGFARKQDLEFIRSAWKTRLGLKKADA
jgi:O-antigen/teichoic acid export membrane protein